MLDPLDIVYSLYRTPDNSAVYYPVEEVLRPYMGMVTLRFLSGTTGKPRPPGLIPAAA